MITPTLVVQRKCPTATTVQNQHCLVLLPVLHAGPSPGDFCCAVGKGRYRQAWPLELLHGRLQAAYPEDSVGFLGSLLVEQPPPSPAQSLAMGEFSVESYWECLQGTAWGHARVTSLALNGLLIGGNQPKQ